MKVKGKHSSVFLVGPFAIKIFNREVKGNAKKEWDALKKIEPFNLAPKPYFRFGRFVVMSRIKGKTVKELGNEVKPHLIDFLSALHSLDKLGIMKDENHRPKKHFFVTKKGVRLIDFERAREGHGNVTQFLTYLRVYYPGIEKLGRSYKKNLKLKPIIDFMKK